MIQEGVEISPDEERVISAWNSFREDPTQILKAQSFASAIEKIDPLKALIVYSYILERAQRHKGFNGNEGYKPMIFMLSRNMDLLRESAAKTIEEEIKKSPNNIDLRLNLAEIHKIRGEYVFARDQYMIAQHLADQKDDTDRKIYARAEITELEKIMGYN